jgi:DNA (cytosine-5)-methyltransferase 1
MRYLDTFAGIGTAELAFGFHGWGCLAHAETNKFASAVLKTRFPDVPNLGDVTRFMEWPDLGTVDLVCGGTPCQAFSLAGLRRGLADARGNLMLSFLGVVGRYRPRWVVWENVTGVLSQDAGRAFAAFLAGLEDLGYGFAWRVLDAQYFRTQRFPRAVPQRRRRVFLCGYLGNWRPPAEILFEPESLRRDHPPSRAPRKGYSGAVDGEITGHRLDHEVIAARLVSFGEYEIDGVASPVLERDHKYASDLVVDRFGVRRLTPRECERLQGLPDDWTLVPYRKKPASDAARYRVIGNAWPLNSADWIAERITATMRLEQ